MTWLGDGFAVFAVDPEVTAWIDAARGPALAASKDPAHRAAWLRHGGTWFAGVDLLENAADGRVAGGPPLGGAARATAEAVTGALPLHRAQISVTYPGYPRKGAQDGTVAHRYRLRRDAAHLDGLLPEGPERRRHLREPHGYILGLPLTRADAGAAPLVVYQGSHAVMRAAFRAAFAGLPPSRWGDIDVTDAYQAARRHVFETCPRRRVSARPGEAILLHRLSLHGIAPWESGANADPEGRAIAYFRPLLPDIADWLNLP